MPTLFGRRYMRDKVPMTETVVGAIVLVLMAGVVVAVVVISALPSRALFEVQPGNERVPAGRHDAVARAMMPQFGTAGWSEASDVRVIGPAALAEFRDFCKGLDAYDVECAYTGRYRCVADPAQSVVVLICSAGAPRDAFGLFHANVPADGEPLNAGCAGWQMDSRGGFWAGRYYTCFDRSAVQTDAPTNATIAGALGSVQLRYGAPFWAEAALPADGRRADSFRYVRTAAAGLDVLGDAFLADYDTGVTAFVTEPGSGGKATGLVEQLQRLLENSGRVQSAPAPPDSTLLAGDLAGRQLVVFADGARVYGVLGDDMASASAFAKAMLALVRPQTSGPTPAAPVASVQSLLPEVALADFGSPDDVRVFTPENLWEKINGRADIYLSFHMARMTFGTYRNTRDPERSIDVYLYDMGSPDNAFGIYRAEMGSHTEPVPLGREGYASPGGVFLWTGNHYVRVEVADTGEEASGAALAVARAVSDGVEDDGKPLWADALLPAADKLENTFEYHATNAFSLDFLSDVFSADYRAGDKTFKTFIHRAADASAAEGVFDAYAKFFEEYGTVGKRESREGYDVLVGDSGGVIDAVFRAGPYVGGVTGCDDAALAEERTESFAASLMSHQNPSRK